MKSLSIDIETYSPEPLSKCGVYRYVESPDFELLLFGYSCDGDPVQVVDLTAGERIPNDVVRALADDTVTKWAYNAAFERICLSRYLGLATGEYLDPSSWRCSMVWSAYLGLPMSLEGVGAVLGLEKQKLKEGKELVRYFCTPATAKDGSVFRHMPADAPDKWALFKAYNLRDVETEMAIQDRLSDFPVPESVWDEYHIDQEINDRGVMLDMDLVERAIEMDGKSREELTAAMKKITDIDNPNSVQQMRQWLADNGLEMESLGKKEVTEKLRTAPPELREVLLLRQQLAMSSVKKYQAMKTAVCSDGRARGMFMFYGANRTGRFSGRLIQMQNLRRNDLPDLAEARSLVKSGDYEMVKILYGDVPDTLSQLVRTAFVPMPGCRFIVSDFSAIEARVIAWLAGEQWKMDAFANGEDIYCTTASRMFGVPVVKHGENGELRAKGKVAELACIAEGQPVLTNRGLIPIERVTTDDLLWDGESWVSHGGVVYKGEQDVVTYDGLTATPDHLVWTDGLAGLLPLGAAKVHGVKLAAVGSAKRVLNPNSQLALRTKVYDIRNAGPHHRFTVSGKLVHNCGYGGAAGALKAMGALEMGVPEDELKALVTAWREANPNIVQLWQDVNSAATTCVGVHTTRETHGLEFNYEGGTMFITLPSGRQLAYTKPRLGMNRFGGQCITYEGIGGTKKWERLDTYGPKIVENCTQAIARDILCYAMKTLRNCRIVMHVHDELVIEANKRMSLEAVCEQMSRTPPWAPGLLLRADGYECDFYMKS